MLALILSAITIIVKYIARYFAKRAAFLPIQLAHRVAYVAQMFAILFLIVGLFDILFTEAGRYLVSTGAFPDYISNSIRVINDMFDIDGLILLMSSIIVTESVFILAQVSSRIQMTIKLVSQELYLIAFETLHG